MTNFEYLKSLENSLDFAHEICDAMELMDEDTNGCEVCPVRSKCYEGHNAIQAYLMREKE